MTTRRRADPVQALQREAQQFDTAEWPDGLLRPNRPKATYGNTRFAIEHLELKVRFDSLNDRLTVDGRPISENEMARLRDTLYRRCGFMPSRDATNLALRALARPFNPIIDWLEALEPWDRRKRIDRLFIDYLGAEDTKLNRAFGRKLICAMVRRAKHPGHKWDYTPILEGRQGIGKSLFCHDLAVREDWYSNQPVLGRDPKKQKEVVKGRWVMELDELQGMGKTTMEKVKAFLTRTVDSERPAWGPTRDDAGRTFVTIGTTNMTLYLTDPSGNRRYWPVAVTQYRRDKFLRDRDQLFAEALAVEARERLWLGDANLESEAARLQEERRVPHPYQERLESFIGTRHGNEQRASSQEVFRFLNITGTDAEAKHVADAMDALGWGRTKIRETGRSVWGYRRSVFRRAGLSSRRRRNVP
jgi:predicted P-loop ATPase